MVRRGGTLFLISLIALSTLACGESDDAGAGTNIETGKGYNQPCTLDVNCRSGLSCLDGACMPTHDTEVGGACIISAECLPELYCTYEGVCGEAGTAQVDEVCEGTAFCAAGTVCRPVGFVGLCKATGEVDLNGACIDTPDCLAGLGCVAEVCTARGDMPGFVPQPDATCEGQVGGDPRVFFEVPRGEVTEFYRLPFPNDVRLAGGHPDVSGHILPTGTAAAASAFTEFVDAIETDLDGFGLNPAVIFRFSKAMDLPSLKNPDDSARFAIYDITTGADEYAAEHSVSWAAVSGGGTGGPYVCDNWVGMRVAWGRPLLGGHTYAAIIWRGVRVAEGGPEFGPDADLAALLGDSAPADSVLTAGYQAYAPLRSFLGDQGLAKANVIGATVFTTQTSKELIPQIREAVRAEPAPVLKDLMLCDGSAVSPCDDGLEGDEHMRGCFGVSDDYYEFQGTVTVPVFQEGAAPYFEPKDGGALALDAQGKPKVVRTEDVCVSITVPKNVTMPADGWPLLIYGHGTGGTYRTHANSDLAEQLSTIDQAGTMTGAVVLGFDQVVHGTRAGESTLSPQVLYFNYANPRAARGHLFQGTADIFTLALLAEGGLSIPPEVSPTGEAIAVNPTHVSFFGHSQGSQYGLIALPYEPVFEAALFSGAGGGLLRGMIEKTQPINIADGVKAALGQLEVDTFNPVLNLVQMYFEAVDPVNYGEYVLYNVPDGYQRPHLMHFYGVGDTYAPDSTQRTLAVALGSFLVEPAAEPFGGVNTTPLPASANFAGVTALVRQYVPEDSDKDGVADYDGHFVVFRHPQGRQDLRAFLGSLFVDGVPTLSP